MKDSWFTTWVREEVERCGLTATARRLGEPVSTVQSWKDGSSAKLFDRIAAAIERAGGDIERALPPGAKKTDGKSNESVADATTPYPYDQTVTLLGSIPAGTTDDVQAVAEEIAVDVLAWNRSPAWSLTQPPTMYLRILGNSMEPDFPNDGLIAVRAPRPDSLSMIPRGWPCVLEDLIDGRTTLKRYHTAQGKGGRPYAIGVACNPTHAPVVFPKGCLVRYLVVGQCAPHTATPKPIAGGRILRESTQNSED